MGIQARVAQLVEHHSAARLQPEDPGSNPGPRVRGGTLKKQTFASSLVSERVGLRGSVTWKELGRGTSQSRAMFRTMEVRALPVLLAPFTIMGPRGSTPRTGARTRPGLLPGGQTGTGARHFRCCQHCQAWLRWLSDAPALRRELRTKVPRCWWVRALPGALHNPSLVPPSKSMWM
jgi:hypothetical protein